MFPAHQGEGYDHDGVFDNHTKSSVARYLPVAHGSIYALLGSVLKLQLLHAVHALTPGPDVSY